MSATDVIKEVHPQKMMENLLMKIGTLKLPPEKKLYKLLEDN